ncbi:Disease resistance protein RPP13 [Carex littledalei]|uniref:Disease resistance protein RPP13 n=1 Tax=Carex littledalei TaxID=544730 RepID=A0A833RLT1_9POAL|nr:Disease resistance protein RPP13 [Carex littledalei]
MENGRLTATPESVKFAIRKIEDVQSSEAAAQSGATTLSGVFYELQLPKDRAITQSAQQSLRNIDDIWLLGLEIHHKCILQRLVDQSLQTRSVVQVVGTKAFAKRVLAEKIYQSTEVKTHFEACFWLFPPTRLVTDDDDIGLAHCNLFKPIDILRKMLLKLGDTNLLDAHDEDYQIMSRLRQSLNGKRCLLVIDNCWMELWTLVNTVFPDGNNGSRVLITSEKQGQNDYKYELPFLGHKDSLELPEELGEKDFSEFEHDHWYSRLPSVLKMCIAYTAAVFPCGSIVLADSLIRLWIVEGIIPHEEGRTTESIAESYLDQLVQRGLMRIIGACYHNQATHPIRSIILNPIVHRIISSKAQDDTIIPVMVIHSVDDLGSWHVPAVTPRKLIYLHRLALHLPYEFNHMSSFGEGAKPWHLNYPSLHSLFFFGYVPPIQISPFSFLRVLAVFSSHIQFPEEYTPCWLDGLINLRYLGFIVCLVKGRSLGKTLDHLGKLEILDLSASIVSGLSEFINKNKKVNVVGPAKEELPESWSPVPDMSQ